MLETLLLSAIGGAAYQILPFIEAINGGNTVPSQLNFRTLILVIFYAALGAFISYLYFDPSKPMNKILAAHIGASAPLILRAFGTVIPKG